MQMRLTLEQAKEQERQALYVVCRFLLYSFVAFLTFTRLPSEAVGSPEYAGHEDVRRELRDLTTQVMKLPGMKVHDIEIQDELL